MGNGLNAISVESLNPYHFITREAQQDVTQQLLKRKIHIAMIQETHIPQDRNFIRNEYRVITAAVIPNPKKQQDKDISGRNIAWVAKAIRNEMAQRISQIERVSHRILKIILGREKPKCH